MNESLTLRDATVQEIQWELLRRTQFNALDGEAVCASLERHRELWTAVMLDRQGLADYKRPRHLLMMGLIKLRDLPDNFWNADTLFILTPTREAAARLADIIREEDWGGEVLTYEDQSETDSALGTGGVEYGLLSVWWD